MTATLWTHWVTGALLVLSTCGAAAAQQETRSLSLDEAVQLALDRNLDIKVERIAPQLFDFSLSSLKATYLPVMTSQLGTQLTVTPSTSTIAGASAASGISNGLRR